jgi:hypothetical protein
MVGNQVACGSRSTPPNRLDLCGGESGWQERGASGPGPLALGEHQGCRRARMCWGLRHQPASSARWASSSFGLP